MDDQAGWDYVIVGSGFGGSVCALRLVDKGYRVLLCERGGRLTAADFPKTNWNLKRWMWAPALGWRGLFKMTFLRHLTVLSGVGVGGGSLVYGNTLPIPGKGFFEAPAWRDLAAWEAELMPHYATARRMLGAVENPIDTPADRVLAQVADDLGKPHGPTTVAVYFGSPGVTVADPFFGGEGPARTGCTACGGCLLGCRVGAKNTLDKNYLHLAEQRGLTLQADAEVTWVQPAAGGGYAVTVRHGASRWPWRRRTQVERARHVIFAGGVLGTVKLLLTLQRAADGLPRLSKALGTLVRTNSESIIGIVAPKGPDMSHGIAISSIVHTDPHSSLEPVRYPAGAGFFRTLALPHVAGDTTWARLAGLVATLARRPWAWARAFAVRDFARQTLILLYMRSLEGHLRLALGRSLYTGWRQGLVTRVERGAAPRASMPEASALAARVAERLGGLPVTFINETVLDVPTTAHVLGGCPMGPDAASGVIDAQHRVYHYEGLLVIDGSAVSANPGVNPSLTICAMAERAMGFVPPAPSDAPR